MFQHESIEKLWKDIQWFGEKRKAAAEVLLQKLDKGGDISSVVVHWSKSPYAKISLLDHTVGVVREAMKLDDPQMLTYQLLVLAALGHDISKLRGHLDRRPGKYFTIRHAIKSAILCQQWLRDHLPEQELDMVVRAVNLHHEKGHEQEDTFLGRLIRADLQERRNELNQLTGDLKGCRMIRINPDAPVFVQRERDLPPIQPPDPNAERLPFFEPVGFLVRLLPHINNMDAWTGRGPEAVSMPNGVCYVTTYRAFRILRQWGHEVGYGDLMDAIAQFKVNPERMNNAGYFIGQQLREIGALAEHELPPGGQYTHRKFRVITQYGKYKENQGMYYIPILTRFLGGDIVALEERKRNTLFRNITKIYPDTTVWKKGGKSNG